MGMNGNWNYVPGPNTLGIGVENMALMRQGVGIDEPIYGPRYNIRSSFAPFMGAAQFPVVQELPHTSLRGNGVYLSGEMALQALTEYNKDNKL